MGERLSPHIFHLANFRAVSLSQISHASSGFQIHLSPHISHLANLCAISLSFIFLASIDVISLSVPPPGQVSTPPAHTAHLRGMRIAGCGVVDS